MNSKTPARKRLSFRQRLQAVGVGSAAAVYGFAASAQTIPTDLAGAETFMSAQGALAVGIAAVVTLIVLGLKGTKLPRRA